MTHREITKEQWQEAVSKYVIVTIWSPKGKRKQPTVRVTGDYDSYTKAYAARKKMEKALDSIYSPERRTIYVARKFDVDKLNVFDTFSYPLEGK